MLDPAAGPGPWPGLTRATALGGWASPGIAPATRKALAKGSARLLLFVSATVFRTVLPRWFVSKLLRKDGTSAVILVLLSCGAHRFWVLSSTLRLQEVLWPSPVRCCLWV